jgi:hypothetical protein
MSFSAIDQLTNDVLFNGRVRACTTQQSENFQNDERQQLVAAAQAALRGQADPALTLARMAAAGPGMADTAGDPVDQTRIADADILASVQANFPTVAALYYDADGTPITP